ncbi:hypothetical protein MESS2_290005 [Mesorhizobium metallidurans STM 2683]|uniref:Uncharacterized protein n=1 Tax=Mesorhizobium metallidurans STM 2683 TaxID=1297569 RepID=M5EN62_9HYPH|nr:hypothetical protein MESS2_290005 [Mesorhizobium metallidurans STM 2683]
MPTTSTLKHKPRVFLSGAVRSNRDDTGLQVSEGRLLVQDVTPPTFCRKAVTESGFLGVANVAIPPCHPFHLPLISL